MNNFFKIVIIILIATGGVFMADHYGNCNSSKYSEYSSQDTELNITMDYVSDWKFSEHRGSYGNYAQVQFYGEYKNDIAPSIIVTVKRESKVKFTPLTIQGLADDTTQKRMLLEDAQVVSRSDSKLLNFPAIDLTLTYKQPDQLRSFNAKMIPFKERIVIFQKDDRFYTVRYVNPEQVFEEFEEAFLHCLGTLSIKE